MKFLVFGGAFDPPHKAHVALLRAAVRAIMPDRVFVVPAWRSPFKAAAHATASERAGLVRAGIIKPLRGLLGRRLSIHASELRSRRAVYTVETLELIKTLHPGAELHVLVGSDNAASFDSWKSPLRLRREASWWTARRPGAAGPIPPFFKILPERMPDIASTDIRVRLLLGEDVSRWLVPDVVSRIRRSGLYGIRLRRRLRGLLPAPRLRHTLAVADLARRLARRWGVDEEKAALAALLHDLGRAVPAARLPGLARRLRLKIPRSDETLRRAPLLAHSYVSEHWARKLFDVDDPAILRAIRRHTLGAPAAAAMSPLDKTLYIADSASTDRRYRGVEAVRQLAFRDLDAAFKSSVAAKLRHALIKGEWLHPQGLSLWNSFRR